MDYIRFSNVEREPMKYHRGGYAVDDSHTTWHCPRRSRMAEAENGHVTNKGKPTLTLSRDSLNSDAVKEPRNRGTKST